MKVFKMNETDTVVAKSLEDAIKYQNSICEGDLDIKEITDLENNYCYFGLEDHPDTLKDGESIDDYRISFKELIEKHGDECPLQFTTDI